MQDAEKLNKTQEQEQDLQQKPPAHLDQWLPAAPAPPRQNGITTCS